MVTEFLLKVDLGLCMVTSPNEGETQRDKKKVQGWVDSVAGTRESLRPPEMGSGSQLMSSLLSSRLLVILSSERIRKTRHYHNKHPSKATGGECCWGGWRRGDGMSPG